MDLMFHAPYVLRGALLFLAAGLPLVIWPAARRRDWQQVGLLARLFVGAMLIAGGGVALTEIVPDAHAADVALGEGVVLVAAGAASVLWAAFGLRTGRGQQARKE